MWVPLTVVLPPPPCHPQGKKEKKGKKKKDPTADRSIESLFAELVSNGILTPCPHVHVRDYLGSASFMQTTLEKVGGVWAKGECRGLPAA